jgi:uncharacterized protein (TIGR03435 family)
MMRIPHLATTTLLAACLVCSQTQPPPPAFEVAAIKPNLSNSDHHHSSTNLGGVVIENYSLRQCVTMAYGLQDSNLDAPDWMANTFFDINAKMPEGRKESDLPAMMKSLLQDRFQLKVHQEERAVSGYALVVNKGGLKIKEVEPGDGGTTNSTRRSFDGAKVTMQRLADYLARMLNRPVIDKTESKAVYDMHLKFTPESAATEKVSANPDAPPTIFTALPEQLGLKLQSEKVTVPVVVVDHIEKTPTEN